MGTGFHLNGGACGNDGGVGDDVQLVGGEDHILIDDLGQDGACADILIHCTGSGIGVIVRLIQGIFAGDGHIQGEPVIVGAILGYGDQEGILPAHKQAVLHDLSAVLGGIGAHAAVIHGGVLDGDIGIGHAGSSGDGVNGHQGILAHAPAVAQGQTQGEGLAGIDDTVAVVLCGILGIVKDLIVLHINFGLGHHGQRRIQIGHLGEVVAAVDLGIQTVGMDPGGGSQLTVDKLGGILVPVGEFAAQNGCESRHHRGRHGSTAEVAVLVAGEGGHDILAGGIEFIFHTVVGDHIPVGEGGLSAGLIHTHNAQNIGQGGGIIGDGHGAFVMLAVVAGGSHQHTAGVGRCQSILNSNGTGSAAEGHIDDLGAVFVSIEDGLGNICLVQGAVVHGSLDGHDLDIVGNAQHTYIIITGSDDTCHVGAVAVGIVAVALAGNDVHTVVVIDIAVAVVVDAVVGDLLGVDPHVVDQIFVVKVHTGVDDRNHHAGITAGGLHGVVAVHDTAVVEVPLILVVAVLLEILVLLFVEMFVIVQSIGLDLIVVFCQQNLIQQTHCCQSGLDIGAGHELCLIPGAAAHRNDQLQRTDARGL